MHRIFLGVCLLLCLSAPLRAQQFEPGDVSVSPDPAGLVLTLDVQPFVPYELFVVVADPPGGIAAFELSVNGLFGTAVILQNDLLADGTNVGTTATDYIVDLTGCAAGSRVRLVRLEIIYLSRPEQDTAICPDGSEPSSFDGPPGYVDCEGQRRTFGAVSWQNLFPEGCLILNPTRSCGGNVYGIPERLAQPGQRVVLPVTVDRVSGSSPILCPSIETYGVDGTLRFDPTLVDLVSLRLAAGGPDWEVSFQELAPGEVHILARDAGVDSGNGVNALTDLQGGDLLLLEFDVVAAGTAEVTFDARECRADPGSGPCDFRPIPLLGGAITQDPVDADETSFGAVKARFGGND